MSNEGGITSTVGALDVAKRLDALSKKLDLAIAQLVALSKKLDLVFPQLQTIQTQGAHMAGELQTLEAQVAKNTDTEASAIVLLGGIKAALDAAIASNNPAALADLSAHLGTSQQALAAAIVANTPAASLK